jgi:hypothetical protein
VGGCHSDWTEFIFDRGWVKGARCLDFGLDFQSLLIHPNHDILIGNINT